MFEGVYTALVTPFRDGAVDERTLHELVEQQIAAGVDGLVPCGSTGEAATLSHAEHRRVIEVVVAAARGRVRVLAGTGSNSTAEAIALTLHAKEAGAGRRAADLSLLQPADARGHRPALRDDRARDLASRWSSTTSPGARPRTSCPPRSRGWPRSSRWWA